MTQSYGAAARTRIGLRSEIAVALPDYRIARTGEPRSGRLPGAGRPVVKTRIVARMAVPRMGRTGDG